MTGRTSTAATTSDRSVRDLGIVDGLVQLAMLVQSVLADVADGADLSVQQARLLGVLRDREPTMAQLAHVLDLDRSSTTGLVDRAERRGLVHRITVPEDGRSFRVVLSAEGRRLTEVLGAEVGRRITAIVGCLDDPERSHLSRLATRMVVRAAEARGVEDTARTEPSAPGDHAAGGAR